jgi:folate-dependent phosphoribosylglycinamide formyltransferase PurN
MNTKKNNQKPLKVIILCTANHIGSTIILNKLIKDKNVNVVGIIKSTPIRFSRSGLKKLKDQMKKTGWHFSFLMVWSQMWHGLGYFLNLFLPQKNRILTSARVSSKYNIPLKHINSINSDDSFKFIAKLNPDLIISAYYCQILKPVIFELPTHGTINIHPGWLPAYRGAMSYFWVLKNKEDYAGTSIHYIDEKIDTGKLIARRKFKIKKGMTQHLVLIKTAIVGAHLLKSIVRKISNNLPIEPLITNVEEPAYYGFPGNEEFDEYFSQNRFFRIRDVLGYFLR